MCTTLRTLAILRCKDGDLVSLKPGLEPLSQQMEDVQRNGVLLPVGRRVKVSFMFVADLKFELAVLGRLGANSLQPCPWCDYHTRLDRGEANEFVSLTGE